LLLAREFNTPTKRHFSLGYKHLTSFNQTPGTFSHQTFGTANFDKDPKGLWGHGTSPPLFYNTPALYPPLYKALWENPQNLALPLSKGGEAFHHTGRKNRSLWFNIWPRRTQPPTFLGGSPNQNACSPLISLWKRLFRQLHAKRFNPGF